MQKDELDPELLIQNNRMVLMGEMVSAIAHQWRQPLSSIKLLIQDFPEAYRHGEVDEQYAITLSQKISRHVNFLSDTIEDFRNFYKIKRTGELFSVSHTIEETLHLAEVRLISSEITATLHNNLLGSDGMVFGFQNELKQVILNLINNASEALSVRQGERAIELFLEWAEEGLLRIRVQDNGPGIRDDVMGKIFDSNVSTKDKQGGSGIGLYLSKMIIETRLGGTIELERMRDPTTFCITLPCAQKP